MFITIEDETGVANLVLWADRFEAQRRLVLSAGMIACHGRVQREGEVIHVVTDRLEDLSDLLRSVGERDEAFPITHGRGDGATHPAGRDPRTGRARAGRRPVRDIYVPDLRLGSGIKVPTQDFRCAPATAPENVHYTGGSHMADRRLPTRPFHLVTQR